MRPTSPLAIVAALALAAAFPGSALAQPVLDTVAGDGPDDIPATAFPYRYTMDLDVDSAGNIAFLAHNRIYLVDTTGHLRVGAGSKLWEALGDGGPARDAGLVIPTGVLMRDSGDFFVYDFYHGRLRKVLSATGTIRTETFVPSWGGPEVPVPVEEDSTGHLYWGTGFAEILDPNGSPPTYDPYHHRILRYDPVTGVTEVVAGNGGMGFGGDGGPAVDASFDASRYTVDASGNLYIVANRRVRRVDAVSSLIETVAGTGNSGFSGDGGPAVAADMNPFEVAVDGSGHLYITGNYRVRRVDAGTGLIETIAGTGVADDTGDGGPASSADIRALNIDLDGAGNLYIGAVTSIRRIDAATGIIESVVGPGPDIYLGDGLPARQGQLHGPVALGFDGAGNLFVVEWGSGTVPGYSGGLRRIDGATGIITSLIPAGVLDLSVGMAVDAAGNVYVANCRKQIVQRVDAATGAVTRVAGILNSASYSGDGGSALSARLNHPTGLALNAAGTDLYIVDDKNNRIRKVNLPSGIITTVAGTGAFSFSGDGGPALNASFRFRRFDFFLCRPGGISVAPDGDLLIGDAGNGRVRRVDLPTGIITTVAGGGSELGDGGPATLAQLTNPTSAAEDAAGNIFIADSHEPNFGFPSRRVRWVEAGSGIIRTLAGTGWQGFSGDGTPAPAALLADPASLAVGPQGDVYLSDRGAARIRRISFPDRSGNSPPAADAGPDREVYFTTDPRFGTRVSLDGSGSADPDAGGGGQDIVLYQWFKDSVSGSHWPAAEGRMAEVGLLEGTHTLVLRVVDSFGETSTDAVEITVIHDAGPPPPPPPPPSGVSLSLSPQIIWPPNDRLVDVSAEVTVEKISGPPIIRLVSIITYDAGGHAPMDVQGADLGTADFDFQLRASRGGTGTGRIYQVTYSVSDDQGNTVFVAGEVVVPHDRGVRPRQVVSSGRTLCSRQEAASAGVMGERSPGGACPGEDDRPIPLRREDRRGRDASGLEGP